MNLTSLLSTAAGGWLPWAATAATNLAGQLPFSLGLSSPIAEPESAKAPALDSADPEFPLSASDRDRLERLLHDDLDLLASTLRSQLDETGGGSEALDVTLDASGGIKANLRAVDGSAHELDLGKDGDLSSLLRRIGATLRRLSPGGNGNASTIASESPPATWTIHVDRSGARLLDGE